ncbi:MAG: hypothetical protein QN122_13495 [Armatimonadota bacterium]|nr:hypothetical protein [Armatimonadota bacterium]
MALETKSLADAATNWAQVTPGRSDRYVNRAVANAQKWLSNFLAGIPNWQAGVTAAGVPARMRASAQSRGAQRFPAKIQAVGAARFGQGVQAGRPNYEQGFGPYLQVIQGLTLPAKGPRGDPRNYQRVSAVGDALHRARMAQAAAGG